MTHVCYIIDYTFTDPPDPPTIMGYTEGTPIETGTTQTMTCVSQGGNPLPTLRWFRKDKEVIKYFFFKTTKIIK